MSSEYAVSSDYAFAATVRLRALGGLSIAFGALVLLLVLLVAVTSVPPVAVLVVAAVVALTLLGAWSFGRRAVVVSLDETGYRVRYVRGAGVRHATWRDVHDVVDVELAGHRCVRLRLRDGRATTVPLDLLAGGEQWFLDDLREHLNRGHGYRPLRRQQS